MVYFQCADGSPTFIHAHASSGEGADKQASHFDLVVHCLSRQGDWDLALRYNAEQKTTAAFWSLDHRIDTDLLLEDLQAMQDLSLHPMLLPCIMLAAAFRSGLGRRNSIKEKLVVLEDRVRLIHRRASQANVSRTDFHASRLWLEKPQDVEALYDLLHMCRGEQSSREGQYEFWRSLYESIKEGFVYAETITEDRRAEKFRKAHDELRQWSGLTWRKLESLRARDMDHITRIDNASLLASVLQPANRCSLLLLI
jgi:hypothetical protein